MRAGLALLKPLQLSRPRVRDLVGLHRRQYRPGPVRQIGLLRRLDSLADSLGRESSPGSGVAFGLRAHGHEPAASPAAARPADSAHGTTQSPPDQHQRQARDPRLVRHRRRCSVRDLTHDGRRVGHPRLPGPPVLSTTPNCPRDPRGLGSSRCPVPISMLVYAFPRIWRPNAGYTIPVGRERPHVDRPARRLSKLTTQRAVCNLSRYRVFWVRRREPDVYVSAVQQNGDREWGVKQRKATPMDNLTHSSVFQTLHRMRGSMSVAAAAEYVTLTSVAEAYCAANCEEAEGDQANSFAVLWQKYKEHWGTVVNSHFCTSVPAACVYLRNNREEGFGAEHQLELAFPPRSGAPGWVSELLMKCNGLQVEIRQTSVGRNARLCSELVFLLVTQLLKVLDQYAAELSDSPASGRLSGGQPVASGTFGPPLATGSSTVESAEQILFQRQFADIRDFFIRSNQRTAQLLYFTGMVACWLALLGVVALTAAGVRTFGILDALDLDAFQLALTMTGLLIGGLGGIVSVMQRMTAGKLSLDYRVDRQTMILLGVIRPLIGAVFAVLLFALFMASLIPMANMPPMNEPSRLIYTYGAIAFFAGFSERWAQDMIAAGQGRLSVTSRDDDPPTSDVAMSSARSTRV